MHGGNAVVFIAALLLGMSCSDSQSIATPDTQGNTAQIEIPGGVIHVRFDGNYGSMPSKDVDRWIRTAAHAVEKYFGHFPVKRLDLHVHFKEGKKVEDGVTYDGERIEISVGTRTPIDNLDADWTLTHEMFHLAFPDLDPKHLWMNEGLSTYLEPIARVRFANMSVEQFWRETLEGMPDGLPQPGDHGLDRTHTWGRTYWGGAMFWFLADVQIRKSTDGGKSLDNSIRAILAAGGNGSVRWDIARVIEVGDQATGTQVLANLYEQMGQKPFDPDLPELWKQLGVEIQGDKVIFDDKASLAKIRIDMTRRTEEATSRPKEARGS